MLNWVSRIREAITSIEAIKQERDDLKVATEGLTERVTELTEQRDHFKNTITALEKTKTALTEANEELVSVNSKILTRVSDLEETLADTAEEIERVAGIERPKDQDIEAPDEEDSAHGEMGLSGVDGVSEPADEI